MSRRDAAVLLADIRDASDKIGRYVGGLDLETFLADEKTVDAVVRNLEIIGEAARQMPDDFKRRYPAIQWTQMAGLRNRIVHDYAGVDLEIVWEIITTSLSELRAKLDAIG
jgi:uncharacterized protein with HEPN domain